MEVDLVDTSSSVLGRQRPLKVQISSRTRTAIFTSCDVRCILLSYCEVFLFRVILSRHGILVVTFSFHFFFFIYFFHLVINKFSILLIPPLSYYSSIFSRALTLSRSTSSTSIMIAPD
jgi:hypothetical protein